MQLQLSHTHKGIESGYFTLEGSGLIGHCSIFNDLVPPRANFSEWRFSKRYSRM